ncbi:metastasis-associated protein MTA3-like isoform X2 [Halichondria panicea]|uniref:metastasis-associated protein MTA3-like isoform X2 n=1 Tax=Halichondria panicea TaxID=6063 RepID=UPI00312B45BA
MAEGLYRIGECIYMEVYPPPMPYQICKIEELRKNSKGSVEVAAKCFYRRKDLPANLLVAADRHTMATEEENEVENPEVAKNSFDKLGELDGHLIRHRELFLSRQVETYKIDMVRGKCTVSLLNELEEIKSYIDKEDTFFYSMVYDPSQKTLLVDKGEIRVGGDYQAEISPYIDPESREPVPHPAAQMWAPGKMADNKVEQFLVVARSIGTFARALLDGAKKPQISLRLGAAAASRDITLFHAMDTLHLNVYDITQATSCLVPRGPVLCADELEAWTQDEAKRFEDGLQEQKDFLYIQRKYLPWKPVKSIVAYYYMWKTTDRYQIQKRHRMIEKQNDLKEVIVHLRTPSGGPPTGQRDLSGKAASAGTMPTDVPDSNVTVPTASDGEKGCESCLAATSVRWYQWGPAHEHCRLCNHCYTYWRKYGGLKRPTKWENQEKRTSTLIPGIKKSFRERSGMQIRHLGKKSSKRDDKRNGDLIPVMPFFMTPTRISYYMREKLGVTRILKAARSPTSIIDLKDVARPTASELNQFTKKHRKIRRKPRLSEPLVASLKHNVKSPIRFIRPSPTPISPSYKSRTHPKLSTKGKITTSGTYIPPKSQVESTNQQQAQPQVSTAGTYVPPETTVVKGQRKRKLDTDNIKEGDAPPTKVARPSSPTTFGPGEMFFKVDDGTKSAREHLGHESLLKAARSPNKPITF